MDFVVSTCILHFIVQVKCKNSEALTITTQSDTHYTQLQRSVQSGGAPAPGAPLLPTPLIIILCHLLFHYCHGYPPSLPPSSKHLCNC